MLFCFCWLGKIAFLVFIKLSRKSPQLFTSAKIFFYLPASCLSSHSGYNNLSSNCKFLVDALPWSCSQINQSVSLLFTQALLFLLKLLRFSITFSDLGKVCETCCFQHGYNSILEVPNINM